MRECIVCGAWFTTYTSSDRCPEHDRRAHRRDWSDPVLISPALVDMHRLSMRAVLLRAQARMDERMAS